MSFGYFDLPLWIVIAYTLTTTHLTIITVTVYLHRSQAHRALELHRGLQYGFRFWLWISTGMVTREWVAVHRCHHAKVETAGDPHSPKIVGIRKVLFEGVELYREGTKDPALLDKYGHGCPNDWIDKKIYRPYSRSGYFLLLALAVLLFGPIGITVWAVQMLWIPFFAAGVINGIGHYWGYRNFETDDTSKNITPWGILIGGEELHNNHHAYASSAKFSNRWYEFDIGWVYIRILAWLGLARIKKVAPKLVMIPTKSVSDMDTIMAVITNRFRVTSDYTHAVLHRVYKDEFKDSSLDPATRSGLYSIRDVLMCEKSTLCEESRKRLDVVLSHNYELRTVYEYKQQLQQLWRQQADSYDGLLLALQDWCRQAENTGILALQEFALRIPRYAMQTA